MSLYRATSGHGPDVALLHGWGLHGGVFESLAGALGAVLRVHTLDLPGHGRSPWAKGATDLEGLARVAARHLPERCSLVGWSLGGLVAVRIATLFPARVPRLVLISTSPCGAPRRDWPHSNDPGQLAAMAVRLGRDWRGTVLDFLSLEVRGDTNSLATLRELKQRIEAHGAPSTAALAAGLEILRSVDLRPELGRVRARTLVIAGGYDRLAPPAAVAALAAAVPGARFELIEGAGHAPFLSQRTSVAALIRRFLVEP